MSSLEFLGFDLLRPQLAVYLIGVPVALALGIGALGARRRARAKLVDARHLAAFFPRFSPGRARLRTLFVTAAVFFLSLALIGPVGGYTLREVSRKGLDIVVCLDSSRSMLVRDLRPDRLGRAQNQVALLLDRLKGDRVGLVAFSGDVRNVAPLTHDRTTLRTFLYTVTPDDNLMGGTDIGAALEHALGLFDGRTGAHEAIVLLTDGEDLEGRGLEVAEEAARRNIRIYVVGVGTVAGGKIPDGSGFLHDETGSEVVSRLDDETLEAIAAATGGAYLSAERNPLPLEEIYAKRLSRLEGRELSAGKERIPHDLFQWPLVLALVFMLGGAGLAERQPRAAGWKRRTP